DADHLALGSIGRLADGVRHFARLACAVADLALAIAEDDDRGETEALTALHDLGDAVDADELLDQLAAFAVAVLAGLAATVTSAFALAFECHLTFSLKRQTGFTRGVGQCLDTAVIHTGATIEHHFLDAGLYGAGADQLADFGCSFLVAAGLELGL